MHCINWPSEIETEFRDELKNEINLCKKWQSSPNRGERFFYCLITYLAILSVSNTVALRNILLLILLTEVFLSFAMNRRRQKALTLGGLLANVPAIFLLWAAFLFLFPLWAQDTGVAWKNLGGQWFQAMVAWVVGFGAAWVLGARAPGLWLLALASSLPVMLHLLLTLIAWGGGLRGRNYLPTLPFIHFG